MAVFSTSDISGRSFHLSELISLAENLRMYGTAISQSLGKGRME